MTIDSPFIADLATGNPFTSEVEVEQYKTTLDDRLNAAGADQFNSSLNALDSLVGSIGVSERLRW